MDAYLVSGGIIAGKDQSFVQNFFINLNKEIDENGLDELERELNSINNKIDENVNETNRKLKNVSNLVKLNKTLPERVGSIRATPRFKRTIGTIFNNKETPLKKKKNQINKAIDKTIKIDRLPRRRRPLSVSGLVPPMKS